MFSDCRQKKGTLALSHFLERADKKCAIVRSARVARLRVLIRPIKLVIYGVVIALPFSITISSLLAREKVARYINKTYFISDKYTSLRSKIKN